MSLRRSKPDVLPAVHAAVNAKREGFARALLDFCAIEAPLELRELLRVPTADELEAKKRQIVQVRADCEYDLAAALPALNKGVEALNCLSKADVTELKTLKTP